MKSKLKALLKKVGLQVHRTRPESDFHLFDKNRFDFFVSENRYTRRYMDGLKKSNSTSSDNLYKQLRFISFQQLAENTIRNETEGDFAECGCWKGHSTYILSQIIEHSEIDRNFYVFDSFEGGLSDRSAEDINLRDPNQSKKAFNEVRKSFASSEESVEKLLAEFKFINLKKGWIPERFSEIDDKLFAFVHIDVDLFEPTLESLNFFYKRLSKGGVIVIDDYGCTTFSGAKKAVDNFLNQHSYQLHYKAPFGSSFIIK